LIFWKNQVGSGSGPDESDEFLESDSDLDGSGQIRIYHLYDLIVITGFAMSSRTVRLEINRRDKFDLSAFDF
jgi:hypothetical protein